jgi:hypothetical protein
MENRDGPRSLGERGVTRRLARLFMPTVPRHRVSNADHRHKEGVCGRSWRHATISLTAASRVDGVVLFAPPPPQDDASDERNDNHNNTPNHNVKHRRGRR